MRRLVYYYTHLPQPFGDLMPLLSWHPAAWLPPPAEALPPGWLVALHADGALPHRLARHLAHVEVGPVAVSESVLLCAIAWRSASAERLMPVLDADLELTRLDGYGCQLSLRGSYKPPLSVLGDTADRLLGHRVAEACVRRFVLDVASRAQESAVSA